MFLRPRCNPYWTLRGIAYYIHAFIGVVLQSQSGCVPVSGVTLIQLPPVEFELAFTHPPRMRHDDKTTHNETQSRPLFRACDTHLCRRDACSICVQPSCLMRNKGSLGKAEANA
jgi:hypothetical protein